MIRAVVQNGVIQPLEPLPPNWTDGREVVVGDLTEQPANGEMDTWAQEMDNLTASLNDPQEWADLDAVLAEADRQSKTAVRREMGLP
jgi:dienelactone hydrolase